MKCPSCHRLIYSRKLEVCGFCGKALLPEMLLSKAELAAHDAEMRAIDLRRLREAEADRAKRAKKRRAAAAAMNGAFVIAIH